MTEEQMMDAICAGPPVTVQGLKEIGGKVVDVASVTKAVVGQLKVAGLGFGEILSVVVMIGMFIKEYGDDIEAIVKAVLALFGR